MAGRKRSLPVWAQLGEVGIAGRSDDGVDLLQRRREHCARHDGEGRLANGVVLHRVVHQHAAGAAELECGGTEVTDGAQSGLLADLGRISEQGGDHDVEAAARPGVTLQRVGAHPDLGCKMGDHGRGDLRLLSRKSTVLAPKRKLGGEAELARVHHARQQREILRSQ